MAQTYDVIIDTPTRHYKGTLSLMPSGELMNARLDIMDVGAVEAQGKRYGKEIDFAGTAQIAGKDIEYSGRASTWANSFDLMATTNIGEVTIYGTSTGYSAGDVEGNDAGFAGRWADVG